MSNNTIGQCIKSRRKELKMTQAQLGAALNPPVKISTISGYETGYSSPDIDTIIGIASALNCSVMDLILPEFDADRIMIKDAIQTVADKVPPIPGKWPTGLREYIEVSRYLELIGYKSFPVDSAEDTEEIIGYDEDGSPDYITVNKYLRVTDKRSGISYIVDSNEWHEILNGITKYSKFTISEYLSTKEPENK